MCDLSIFRRVKRGGHSSELFIRGAGGPGCCRVSVSVRRVPGSRLLPNDVVAKGTVLHADWWADETDLAGE